MVLRAQVQVGVAEHILQEPLPVLLGVAAIHVEGAVARAADDVDFDVGIVRELLFCVRAVVGDEDFAVVRCDDSVVAALQRDLCSVEVHARHQFGIEFPVVVGHVGIDVQEHQVARFQADARGLGEATEGSEAEFVGPDAGFGIDLIVVDAEVFLVFVPSGVVVPLVVLHAHGLLAQCGGQGTHGLAQCVVAHRGVFALELRAGVVFVEVRQLVGIVGIDGLLQVVDGVEVDFGFIDHVQHPFRGVGVAYPSHHVVALVGCGVQGVVGVRIGSAAASRCREEEERLVVGGRCSNVESGT